MSAPRLSPGAAIPQAILLPTRNESWALTSTQPTQGESTATRPIGADTILPTSGSGTGGMGKVPSFVPVLVGLSVFLAVGLLLYVPDLPLSTYRRSLLSNLRR
ncbi:hypothetical protein EJ06DRAFT_237175 [Trichodelitschia bisporula]|uniref:Uncharacterized protein n=1 Tax=Trichodelitschia bisporula TaxID=703511 RepID=A0A6G1HJZ5_9PEZI|nr:hypothetical protein EJ06DRAFT_237175 [Trichodelitschia bisporula]